MTDEPTIELPGDRLAATVREEFSGDTRPATVEMIAGIYARLGSIQDALFALATILSKGYPSTQAAKEWQELEHVLSQSSRAIGDALIGLARKEGE